MVERFFPPFRHAANTRLPAMFPLLHQELWRPRSIIPRRWAPTKKWWKWVPPEKEKPCTPQKSKIDTQKWPFFKGAHLFQIIISGIQPLVFGVVITSGCGFKSSVIKGIYISILHIDIWVPQVLDVKCPHKQGNKLNGPPKPRRKQWIASES